jgi:hypothetical protein
MSDRVLKEPQRSGEQLQQSLQTQVRQLSRRAYSGAMRSVRSVGQTHASTSPTAILSTAVSSGRWAVNALVFPAATLVGTHVFHAHLILTGDETGADLTGNLEADPAIAFFPVTGAIRFPLPIMGEFSVDEAVTVTLRTYGTTALSTLWAFPRIRLEPF